METGELVPSIIVLHLLTEAMVTIENINKLYEFHRTKAKKQCTTLLPIEIDISEVFKCKHSFHAHFK